MEYDVAAFSEEDRKNNAQPIGEILKELFVLYESRFPGIDIAIVETPANAI